MRSLLAIIAIGVMALGQLNVSAPSPVAITAALPAGSNVIGHVINDTGSATIGSVKFTDGTSTAVVDPCTGNAKTSTPISLASTTSLKLVTKASAKQVYICSIDLVVAGANNVALIEGTKTTTDCDTSTAGVAGGTTAATGWNFTANAGLTKGNGAASVFQTATVNHDVCLLASANTQISGSIQWVQQ